MNEAKERLKAFAQETLDDARAWCFEKSGQEGWYLRGILLVFYAWVFFRQLKDVDAQTPLIGALDFGIHELGHYVFKAFGQFMNILGGSLFQCMVPMIGFAMFWKQRDYFAMTFAFGWLGSNLFHVATYCADANAMQLPLVSPGGGETYHDWNYILDHLGLLRREKLIANVMRFMGGVSMLAFLATGGWLMVLMGYASKARRDQSFSGPPKT